MARSFHPDLDVKRKESLALWPEELVVDHAKRGRFFPPTEEEVRKKMLSIREIGQITPVAVSPTHDKKLELLAGFTRWEAISLWNKENPDEKMRIDCVLKDVNAKEQFLSNIAENRDRNITTVIDDAHNIRRLERDFGMEDDEILLLYSDKIDPKTGAKIPQYPEWLQNRRALLRLSEDEQRAIHEGQLSASVGYALAELPPEERPAVLEEVKKEQKGKKVTGKAIKKIAAKKGLVKEQGPLTSLQMTAAIEYLRDENPDRKELKKFCDAFLKWRTRELPEPDFFRTMKRLFKDS
jgi:ParB-like chromosome segregation protein Spo0J